MHVPRFAAAALVATLSVAAADGRAGEGTPPSGAGHAESPDTSDEELPPIPEDPPHGAQDGILAGAVAGAAMGLAPASAVTRAAPPSARYAALDRGSCEAELVRRNVPFERVADARGVVSPVRLTGPVSGVTFHSMLPAAQRRTSVFEIYDCRLVLALDDYARILTRYGIVEVVHYSVYRPPPARQTGPGRRHAGALAIDAGLFRTRDGRTISVEKDFHGRIGAKTCGVDTAGLPETAVTLRRLVCDAADAQLFNVLLTPDFNWAHRNHFHLEVTAGVRWQYVH